LPEGLQLQPERHHLRVAPATGSHEYIRNIFVPARLHRVARIRATADAVRPMSVAMATTIHLDREVLAWLDREAARRGVRRNRLIANILVREMKTQDDWPPGLFAELVESAMAETDK
jgi:hypothetical protein